MTGPGKEEEYPENPLKSRDDKNKLSFEDIM
jgi:hypothetical protein